MAIYSNRDSQGLAEVIENNCRCSCVGSPVVPGHAARLIQQESNTESGHFIGQCVFVKHPGVRPKQGVGIQTPSHQQARLFAAASAILHLLEDGFLQLL